MIQITSQKINKMNEYWIDLPKEKKKVWQLYNEFRDLLDELHLGYTSKSYVDSDGLTIFNISCCEKFDGSERDRFGLEIIARNAAIRPGEMEQGIRMMYERCIDNLKKYKFRIYHA